MKFCYIFPMPVLLSTFAITDTLINSGN